VSPADALKIAIAAKGEALLAERDTAAAGLSYMLIMQAALERAGTDGI
jgi:hypothetical protein